MKSKIPEKVKSIRFLIKRPPVRLDNCGKVTKIVCFGIELVYVLLSVLLIGFGSYLVTREHNLSFITGSSIFSGGTLLIICGIILFSITLIGVSGTFLQHKSLLLPYIIILLLILILEIITIIVALASHDQLYATASARALNAINKYRPPEAANYNRDINGGVDFIQRHFRCCGWNEAMNWENTTYEELTGMYPKSCECRVNVTTCMELRDGQVVHNSSCKDAIARSLVQNLAAVIGYGVTFAILQVIPISLAIILVLVIRKAEKNQYATL